MKFIQVGKSEEMGLFQKQLTQLFSLFFLLILIYVFEYETIVRINASSFGHSDPDLSSVTYHVHYLAHTTYS